MASLPAQTLFTPEAYITQERKARYKSEYLNGQIFAISNLRHCKTTSLSHSIDSALNIIDGKMDSGNAPNFVTPKMCCPSFQSDVR